MSFTSPYENYEFKPYQLSEAPAPVFPTANPTKPIRIPVPKRRFAQIEYTQSKDGLVRHAYRRTPGGDTSESVVDTSELRYVQDLSAKLDALTYAERPGDKVAARQALIGSRWPWASNAVIQDANDTSAYQYWPTNSNGSARSKYGGKAFLAI